MIKRYSLLLLFLATCFAWAQAQPYNVTIQGTLLETGTGNPIVNHDVYVNYDSSGGFFHFAVVQTDAAGHWSDVATGVTGPGGWADAFTFDCNGNYLSIGTFTYSGQNNNFSTTTQMCAPSAANCAANFSANQVLGTTAYNFTDLSTSGIPSASVNSWAWDFGDGGTSNLQNPSHTYNALGGYRVCLTITTTAGCTASFCDSVGFGGGGPGPCSAFFGVSNVGCNFTFYDSSWAAAGIVAQWWDFGDGTTAIGPNPSHTYAVSGTYQVCMSILAQDSCTDTYCYTVTCGSQPACQASYYWFPDSSGQYSIILVNNSAGSGLSYSWDFGDGSTSTQAYPSHVYAGPGTYIVCLTVSNGPILGCSSTYCDTLVVLNKMAGSVPFSINVVSPATAVAPPAAQANGLQLSPNPASQVVRLAINVATQGEGQVRVLDVQGRTVKAISLGYLSAGLHQQSLDLSTMPDGIYMVELLVNGARTVQKLIVTE
jgi:PKD repeat protein